MQSLNVVENLHLRAIFRMLRDELCDDDIPRRTHIRSRVGEIWEEHISNLEDEMKVQTSLPYSFTIFNQAKHTEITWEDFLDF